MTYTFVYDIENNKVANCENYLSCITCYGVRYSKCDNGTFMVSVGDGYRHYISIRGEYWNTILKIIKENRLNPEELNALVKGLMRAGIPDEFAENFISAVKNNEIKELP